MMATDELGGDISPAHVGQAHLCFDLKMFAFHKQWVIEAGTIVKLLKTEQPNTIDVQSKGSSYEVRPLNPPPTRTHTRTLQCCRSAQAEFARPDSTRPDHELCFGDLRKGAHQRRV